MASRMMRIVTAGLGTAMAPGVALAQQPHPWQLGLQEPNTSIGNFVNWFNDFTTVIMAVIVVLVLGLLLYVMVRFNARANPTPSRTSHNTLVEVAWTVLPILILCAIAIPSFRLLYQQLDIPKADLTLKATGFQWYWQYDYPDNDAVTFESRMLRDDQDRPAAGPKGEPKNLAVDNPVVVPVGKVVRVQVTAYDVIHAWGVPSFGVKMDGYPGRLNEIWFRADRTGVYYGQCYELCGKDHAFMPIAVRVVTDEQFAAWVAAAKADVTKANELLAEMIDRDAKPTKVAGN